MAVAIGQVNGLKPLSRPPRCNRQSFTQLDYNKMLDFTKPDLTLEHSAFKFTYIHKSFSTPCLTHSPRVEDDDSSRRIEIIAGQTEPLIHTLVIDVAVAMASGVNLEPASSGLGGAYFLRAQNGDTIAVAKPIDEEPLVLNNLKGISGRISSQPGMRSSIRIGETGIRESAAYLLDHDGFSGVPPTALVKFSHVEFNIKNQSGLSDSSTTPYKIASLQRFVDHESDAGDWGPSSFSVASVHHIGILDVRLMNLDRHAGNILVRKGTESFGGRESELVPIDHGFCLPEFLDDPYFEWLHWPQALIPFSEAEIDYISNLDPFNDAEMLRNELPSIRECSIRVLVLCTILLKQAAGYGLCLADIGEMMTREFHGGEEKWSELENICIRAMASLNKELTDDNVNSDCLDEEVYEMPYTFWNSPTKGSNYNYGDEGISFGEMDEEEWQMFVEAFQKLLLKAFEERKSTGLSKQML